MPISGGVSFFKMFRSAATSYLFVYSNKNVTPKMPLILQRTNSRSVRGNNGDEGNSLVPLSNNLHPGPLFLEIVVGFELG